MKGESVGVRQSRLHRVVMVRARVVWVWPSPPPREKHTYHTVLTAKKPVHLHPHNLLAHQSWAHLTQEKQQAFSLKSRSLFPLFHIPKSFHRKRSHRADPRFTLDRRKSHTHDAVGTNNTSTTRTAHDTTDARALWISLFPPLFSVSRGKKGKKRSRFLFITF